MPTIDDMQTSLEDATFFHDQINRIVRGSQQQHDLTMIRRYFRSYLHCWKTVLYFVRIAKGLQSNQNTKLWVAWCQRWQQQRLSSVEVQVFEPLRETRDFDTHEGMVEVEEEVAAGLFPIVMIAPTKSPHSRRELISCTNTGLDLGARLIQDHTTVP